MMDVTVPTTIGIIVSHKITTGSTMRITKAKTAAKTNKATIAMYIITNSISDW
jgi:hypothetical protein